MTDEQFKELKKITRLNNPNDYLLSVTDVADRLGVSTKQVYKLIKGGKLPYLTYGHGYAHKVTNKKLNEFIEQLEGKDLSEFF